MQDLVQHLINGIGLGSIYALIALGYTMVYGVLQLINFAHSDVYMMGAFFAYYISRFLHLESNPGFGSLLIAIAASIIGCSILGVLIERFAYRPLRKSAKINILITAIGVSLLLQNLAQIIFGAEPRVFPNILNDAILFNIEGAAITMFDLAVIGVSLLAMVVLHYLIYHTRKGRAMRAVSTNPTVAAMMGVNVDQVISFTFIVGSSLAGIGSVLVGLKYPKIDAMMGTFIGMKAFVAAVFGGIGNIQGAVLGGILLGLSEEFVVAYMSSAYRDALAFGILILILIFRPAGLLGKNGIEKV